ncbi:hypothetical protein [Methanobrevibacter sp.]
MNYLQFDGEEFNPADQMAYFNVWKLLSPEGKKSFEKLLDDYDHDCFINFKETWL